VELHCLPASSDRHASEVRESTKVQNWRHLQLLVL